MSEDTDLLDRFHAVLVDEIRTQRPDLLTEPFTVAEIYQELVPYRTHRDRIGVEMNGDYEHLLIRLLAGEGGYLVFEADAARKELKTELQSRNPNTGRFREFAAAEVRLNPAGLPAETGDGQEREDRGAGGEEGAAAGDGAAAVESLAPEPGGPSAEAPPAEEPAAPRLFDDESSSPVPPSTPRLEPEGAAARAPAGPGEGEEEPRQVGAEPSRAAPRGGTTCTWCRATLPDRENLSYCPFCGTDVHVVPCPSCGEALEPEWRFCIACGAGAASD